MTATMHAMTGSIDPPRTLIDAAALAAARRRTRPATPAAQAKRLIPGFKIVPTTALVSDVLLDAIRNPDRRYVLSTPPRSGKSLLASVIGPLFALMLDPDASVIVKSYADTLALEHSGQARRLVTEFADLLGFEIDQSKSAVDRWLVAGHGAVCSAVESSAPPPGSACRAAVSWWSTTQSKVPPKPIHRPIAAVCSRRSGPT